MQHDRLFSDIACSCSFVPSRHFVEDLAVDWRGEFGGIGDARRCPHTRELAVVSRGTGSVSCSRSPCRSTNGHHVVTHGPHVRISYHSLAGIGRRAHRYQIPVDRMTKRPTSICVPPRSFLRVGV